MESAGLVVGLAVLIAEIEFGQEVPATVTKQIRNAKINEAKRKKSGNFCGIYRQETGAGHEGLKK